MQQIAAVLKGLFLAIILFCFKGCQFMTGSWRWSTSWSWDTRDDALIMMDMNGITTGLNVSTKEYQSCSVESLSYLAEDIKWMTMTDYFNSSKPVMFKLNNMWHLSWVIDVFFLLY